MSKTILITGAAGCIGTNLCKKLLDEGNTVIGVDNFITSTGNNIKTLRNHPNFTFIKHDITKPFTKSLTSHFSLLTSVYHLACPTGVPNVVTLAEEMLLTCTIGTRNVLELAKAHKAKLLFTSSSEVYGDPQVFPQKETYTGNVDPIGIRSPYEEGKRVSESLVVMYVRKYGLDAKIVRIFNTYGPHMSMKDSRVIPNFIQQLQQNKPLTVQGKGEQKRTFCYVDDLVNGFITVLTKGKKGEVYNLGGDQEISIKELAELMIGLAPYSSSERSESRSLSTDSGLKHSRQARTIRSIPRPSHDHQSRKPDLAKVKKLGWKQNVNLKTGLKKTLSWYNS